MTHTMAGIASQVSIGLMLGHKPSKLQSKRVTVEYEFVQIHNIQGRAEM